MEPLAAKHGTVLAAVNDTPCASQRFTPMIPVKLMEAGPLHDKFRCAYAARRWSHQPLRLEKQYLRERFAGWGESALVCDFGPPKRREDLCFMKHRGKLRQYRKIGQG